jgi:hypothetical protein
MNIYGDKDIDESTQVKLIFDCGNEKRTEFVKEKPTGGHT